VPRWLRIVLLVVLIAVTVVVLFTTVFPWVEQRLEDPTMGAGQALRAPR
jgi:Flp pilus assembly pilin Flp